MDNRTESYVRKLDQDGFTLIELVIILVVLGILAAVAIQRFGEVSENSKITATRSELLTLKKGIVGNPEAVSGGQYVDRGFEGDVGIPPSSLTDLVRKPDSIPAYDKFTRLGWNGPYVDSAEGEYLANAWGAAYVYQQASRRILSVGGSDTIAVTF